jgi:hypothetical protein
MASYLPPKHILNTFNPTEFESSLSSEDVETKLNVLDNTKAPIDAPTFTGIVSGITKNMVGLANVDNTSDADKPVSTAQQTVLNLKAPIDAPTFTGTVSGISKSMVGLANVDNTSDADKPVSTAQQTALDGKQATIDSSNRLNANLINDGNVSNTEFSRLNGISANIQNQINGKQDDITLLSNNGDFNVTLSRSDGDTVALDVQGRIEINPKTQAITQSTETEGFVTNVISNFNANAEFNNNVFIKNNANLYITAGRELLLTDATLQLNGSSKLKVSNTSTSNSELEIYHDDSSNDSIISEGASSDLKLQTNGTNIEMRVTDSQDLMFRAVKNGSNQLYYSGSKKLETRTDGVRIINDLITGDDGQLKTDNISTTFGQETVSIQSYIDNGASDNNPNAFNIGNDSRYLLALQPSKGRITIGGTTAIGNAKVSINEQTNNSSLNAFMCMGGTTGVNGALQILCVNNGNGDKKQDGIAIKASDDSNHIINFVSNNTGNTRGKIKGNGENAVSYDTSSDRRLKTNIENMDSQINNIMNLRPVKYNWISNNEFSEGLIAQEVHSVYPNFRENYEETYCKDNSNCDIDCPCDASGNQYYYGLDYGKFTPYIIKSIQELKTMYDDKIQQLEERLNILENN